MARVFVPRSAATVRNVVNGDTLNALAAGAGAPGLTWQELALYNWGANDPREVNRAIFERIGCTAAQINMGNPGATVMTPVAGAQILIPALFTALNQPVRKTHIVDIRPRLPAPAIRFDSLDKWFIPGDENCQFSYRTEGISARANQVAIEIRGSNYANATPTKVGDFQTFSCAPLDIPLRVLQPGAIQRQLQAATWDGLSEADQGTLARRGGVSRPVNVAHSPYTFLARYWLAASDATARIDLEPFWLDFDNTGAQKPSSRAIVYRITDPGNKLKWGQAVITDGAGGIVRRIPLRALDVSPGEHAVTWDGNNSAGAQVTAANMPYRVQVEAHSDEDEDNGLALAAMHTEVRLWVNSTVGTAADPLNDPQCLEFEPAAAWCEPNPPAAGSVPWYKYQLEQAGYHPGPVNGSSRAEYTAALKEYQRSHAATLGANAFRRLPIDGKSGNQTQAELTNAPADERPLFGDLNNNRNDVLRGGAAATLNSPVALPGLAVWVDDRHSYTTHDNTPATIQLGDYRGAMDCGDVRAEIDRACICRPWIPLQARFGLLSRIDPFVIPGGNALPAATANTHKAIGPLRVDWTFREPPTDHATVVRPSGDPNAAQKTRSRAWIGAVTGVAGPSGLGKTWNGRDYINCPEYLSGKAAESSFGPDQLATDPDANGNARNQYDIRVNGRKVSVTLTSSPNLPLATAMNEINTQLIARNVPARASINADGRLVVRTNGFGTKRSIRVRNRNEPDLLRQLGLATGTQNGTDTAVATVTGGALPAAVDTRNKGYVALRVNAASHKVAIPAFENLTRAQVASALQLALPATVANATGVAMRTTLAGVNQRIEVTSDSDAALLTLLGLAVGTQNGLAMTIAPLALAQPATYPATFAATVNSTAACTHAANLLQIRVDGTAVDVELPESATVTPAQILERVQRALKSAGVAAVASLAGGALQIETDGTGDQEIKIANSTSPGLKSQMGSEAGKGSGPVATGGERPDDLSQYFKRLVGNGKDDSLRPWLAFPHERADAAKSAIATIVHDDLAQDDDDFFINQQGRAGIFFRPSRIGGDAYQLRAQVNFEPIPGAPPHPNWATLAKRYRRIPPPGPDPEIQVPQAHTCIFRNWRKDSVRGYVPWTSAPNAFLPGAQDIYRDAYMELIHEGGGALTQFPIPPAPLGAAAAATWVMTVADFAECIRADLDVKGSYFRNDAPAYCPGYAWPYLKLWGFGFAPQDDTAANYKETVKSRLANTWRTYRARLLHRLLKLVEERHGLLRGHTLVEVDIGPQITIREFDCTTPGCGRHRSEVINNPFAANGTDPGTFRANPAACPDCGNATYNQLAQVNLNFPRIAVGINMGAAWLYAGGDSQTWAHEMGHHKHLQHAQANGGSDAGAPGFSLAQHDSVPNPARGGKPRWHRRGWDCFCVMGYDKEPPQRFCGKCLLKLRGWPVEGIESPGGGVGGP